MNPFESGLVLKGKIHVIHIPMDLVNSLLFKAG
jgi:hypothetical protein